MHGLLALSLICAAILAVLIAIGRVGDVAARWHASRDNWKPL